MQMYSRGGGGGGGGAAQWRGARCVMADALRAVLGCGLLLAAAAAVGLGRCPYYAEIEGFDMRRMTGLWYEVERSFVLLEMSGSCTWLNVTAGERGLLAVAAGTTNRWTGASSRSRGVGYPTRAGAPSVRYRPESRLPLALGWLLPGGGLYHVLATDYARYAVVWSCTNTALAHTDHMWVLGREREFPAPLRADIYNTMVGLRLDPDRLILAKNTGCEEPRPRAAAPAAAPAPAPARGV